MERNALNRYLTSLSLAGPYHTTRRVLVSGLGGIYAVIFTILFFQGPALVGENGLLPIASFTKRVLQHYGSSWAAFIQLPSWFLFFPGDFAIAVMAVLGLALSCLLIFGRANVPILFLLWSFQLSLVNSGQLFWSYGWESQVLELTFLSMWLVPLWKTDLARSNHPPLVVAIWAQRWMLFRLMFGAGMIKIRGDQCWRDLTCMMYHYETQPNPNPLTWFFHSTPDWFHTVEVLVNHFVELIVPFGLIGPRRIRIASALIIIVFQATLILSGNLSFLNWLTIVMAIPCLDDQFFARWLSPKAAAGPIDKRHRLVSATLGVLVVLLSIQPAANLLADRQLMNTSFDRLHLINSYGAFGSIGKFRNEIVISATMDKQITDKTEWKEYEFKCKPGTTTRLPCLISPYHYRLDWQIWFSAMRPRLSEQWLATFATKLLQADKKTLDLLESAPFGLDRPRFIKMDLYRYRLASWKEKGYWTRQLIGPYLSPSSLSY